jgi:hypothetical protein
MLAAVSERPPAIVVGVSELLVDAKVSVVLMLSQRSTRARSVMAKRTAHNSQMTSGSSGEGKRHAEPPQPDSPVDVWGASS